MNEKPRKMFDSICVCHNVCKAERVITQLYDGHFRDLGINAKQLSLLSAIRILKNGLVTDIANAMSMDQTTATRNIIILEKQGLVERVSHPDDARKKMVVLTENGEHKRREAMKKWTTVQEKVVEKLGEDKFKEFLELTDTIIKAVT